MTNLLRALLVVAAVAGAFTGGGCNKGSLAPASGNDGGDLATLSCATSSDCTRTEIDHEISSPADCICLYGCPFAITNVATANRRMSQYVAHCAPSTLNCGVDDCAAAGPVACVDQVCVPAPLRQTTTQ